MDRARERPWGVFDSRYKLHDASFGTLLLQVAGLRNRPPPAFVETPQDNAPNTTEAGDTAPNTTEAEDTAPNTTEAGDTAPNITKAEETAPNTTEAEETAPNTTEAGDTAPDTTEAGDTAPQGDTATVPIIEDSNTAWSAGNGGSDEDVEEDNASADDEYDDYSGFDQGDDYHHPVGATYTGPTTKVAQEHQQMIQSRTQQKLDEARGLTQREKLCACFRETFLEAEKNNLDSKEQWETFKYLERLLTQDILSNDIAVLSTTLVNSGHSIVKDHFKGDHVIVQEASKAENGDVFIGLANCETSIHLSGDNAQLPPQKQDVARNPFAQQTNMSMYHRWVSLGYSISELKEQHYTIPSISNIISNI